MGHIEKTSPKNRGKQTRYVSQRNLALKRRRDREDVRRLEKRVAALERIVHSLISKTSENSEAGGFPGPIAQGAPNTRAPNMRDDIHVLNEIAKHGGLHLKHRGSKQD